jgi:hypothetical protein
MDHEAIWQAALTRLQHEMTRATYDTWLNNSKAISLDNQTLIIATPRAAALEWLNHRLKPGIERALREINHPLAVSFVLAPQPTLLELTLPADPTSPDQPAPAAPEISIELLEFDPTRKGWLALPHYATRFWMPYLDDTCWKLWLALKDLANTKTTPTVERLAAMCAGGTRQRLTGRNHRGAWLKGAIEILENERILWYKRTGNQYKFRTLEVLPLLTPTQVATLPPPLPEDHTNWLKMCDLDYEEWQQLTVPTLAKGLA